ncbi:uncharacterized protein [Drosophila bipectinata]|uniref:uncharacterized protein n=1 Tax=Drosophila bipectinata TaxID=42026 RepID=UPI001C89B9E2|nr:uncharacterized protein LOC108134355 [Drosophila bipectinata]
MLHSSYNRAPRRKLIPNLFSIILQVVADSTRPLTEHEIAEAVSKKMERCDEELKRQITVSLHDALIYGYLRVKNFRYSIVSSRLEPNSHQSFRNRSEGYGPSSSIAAGISNHHRSEDRMSSANEDEDDINDEDVNANEGQVLEQENHTRAEPEKQIN